MTAAIGAAQITDYRYICFFVMKVKINKLITAQKTKIKGGH